MARPKLEGKERTRRRLISSRTYRKKLESICFHFNKEEDADVIQWLKSRPVMIDTIRGLVRNEIKKSQDHNK